MEALALEPSAIPTASAKYNVPLKQVLFSGASGLVLGLVLIGLITLTIYVQFLHQDPDTLPRKRDSSLPEPSEIVSLRIYPIKSCRGIEVNKVNLKRSGLELDRNWMFIDAAEKKFRTIRSDPTMTLIDTAISPDNQELTISIKDKDASVTIPAHPSKEWLEENCTLDTVEIWEEPTDAWLYGDEINNVFNAHFKIPVKLVYKGPEPRIARGSADPKLYGKEVSHMFADLMSVQIASVASLDDLNEHLKESPDTDEQLTMERFRPNIIIKGNKPWEEDRWKRVQIVALDHGKEQLRRFNFDVVCRCARCQVPNVDPETASKNLKEPWNTLMKYRRVDTGGAAKYKPCFGMLCVPLSEGLIWVGKDCTLEPLEMTDKHLYNTAKFEDL